MLSATTARRPSTLICPQQDSLAIGRCDRTSSVEDCRWESPCRHLSHEKLMLYLQNMTCGRRTEILHLPLWLAVFLIGFTGFTEFVIKAS